MQYVSIQFSNNFHR